MLGLIPKLKTYAALVGAFFVVAGLITVKAFQSGVSKAKGQQARERLKASQQAREAENEVSSLDSGGVDNGLTEWVRKR